MKTNLFLVLAMMFFWPALTAQAQEIVLDRDALSDCQASLAALRARVYERGEDEGVCEASEEDLEEARRACMVMEGMLLSNAQAMWRLLNPTSPRVFSSAEEVAEAIRDCRPVLTNRCDPPEPPPVADTPDSDPEPSRTPRPPSHRTQRFCVYGAEPVWNRAHTRIVDCVCDPATHMEVRVFGGASGLAGDPVVADDRDVYVGCAFWGTPGASTELTIILDPLIMRIERLERQACNTPSAHPGFQALCDRVTHLEEEIVRLDGRIDRLTERVTTLEGQVQELYSYARATCWGPDHTDEEWLALSHMQRVEICEDFHVAALVDTTGSGGDSNHRFLVSVGVTGGMDFASMTGVVRGDIRAQYEYGFSDDAWLYVRLETGYGTQGDSPNWIATVPIAESANWGFGLGGAFDLTDHVILSAGVSYHGLLNPGPYAPGELWGDYRGHSVTADLGLRLEANPGDPAVFFGELDVSGGWSRIFGERNDEAVPLDSGVLLFSGRIGIRF